MTETLNVGDSIVDERNTEEMLRAGRLKVVMIPGFFAIVMVVMLQCVLAATAISAHGSGSARHGSGELHRQALRLGGGE
jgi:hypothetical protein